MYSRPRAIASVAHRSLGRAPHSPMVPTSTCGSVSVSMAKPRSSFWFALHFAMRSFAAASDGGTTEFDSVVMRPGIHLPLRERGQVVVAHATQPHPLADQDRVAVAECAGNIGEFGHVADTAACRTRGETRFWPPGILPGMARRADIMVMPSNDRPLEAHGH